jgi:CDP-diacylglycerol--glycerol-3-phosphate 3-phosphatidyltransferase
MGGRQHRRPVPAGLRVALPVLGALAFALVLRGLFPTDGVDAWILDPAVAAGLVWAGQLWYVGRHLGPGPVLGRLLGLANLLTLARGALFAVVAGFVVVPQGTTLAWVPAVAYGAGVALDQVDGTVARTVGQETALGKRLDMAFDTFGFVVAPLVAVLWGQLPVWYLSLSAARYLYRGGLAWRRYRGRPVFASPDDNLGRYLAGVQMVFVTAALAPAVPTPLVWTVAPFVLVPSLAVFARDFLTATGRPSPTNS